MTLTPEETARMGIRYLYGYDVPQDSQEGLRLLEQAHALGYTPATAALGACYDHGTGVSKDLENAAAYYREAASRGEAKAYYSLARLLYDELRQDDEALVWARRAVEQGDAGALVILGRAFEYGRGVSQDAAKAVELYQQAASQGNPDGMLRLAMCLRDGEGCAKDVPEAKRLLLTGCDQGDARAWNELGWLYLTEEVRTPEAGAKALECFERAAELGLPQAQEWCGELYAKGPDCMSEFAPHLRFDRDLEKGIRWLQSAVEADMPRAKYAMACLLARGEGVDEDPAAAFCLCREAAIAGETDAQFMLGWLSEEGFGVDSDPAAAYEWFKQAADNGSDRARAKLEKRERTALSRCTSILRRWLRLPQHTTDR